MVKSKFILWFALAGFAALSCSQWEELPTESEAVHFGFDSGRETLVQTKTAYSNDLVDEGGTKYERIDWTAGDRIKVVSNLAATIPGGSTREAVYVVDNLHIVADGRYSETEIIADGSDLYWNVSPAVHYFYAVYPAPAGSPANPTISAVTAPEAPQNPNTVTITGTVASSQAYTGKTTSLDGSTIEFTPDMSKAYMYAAAKMSSGSTGNVPLRFKPLFTAVRVELHAYDDITKLATVKQFKISSATSNLSGDFSAIIGESGLGTVTPSATSKELTIPIAPADQFVLGEKTMVVTFFALPLELTDLTLELTIRRGGDAEDVIRKIELKSGSDYITVGACNKQQLKFGMPDIDYVFQVTPIPAHLPRTWSASVGAAYTIDDYYAVTSYRAKSGAYASPVKWNVTGYRQQGETGYNNPKPLWLTLEAVTGNGAPSALNLTQYYDLTGNSMNGDRPEEWVDPVSLRYKDVSGNYVDNNGVAYAYDLSSHNIYGALTGTKNGDCVETANCYVVSAPGWYRLPLVYGNGIKAGAANPASYTGSGTTDGLMKGGFLNHRGEEITAPWMKDNSVVPDAAGIVWQDADEFIATSPYLAPRVEGDYLYFYVDQLASANAVIAAKIGSTVCWSWHIWGVLQPSVSLNVVEVQRNELNAAGNPNPYKSVYQNTPMFQTTDLGQNTTGPITQDERWCEVQFTQEGSGKTHIITITQSGVDDQVGRSPQYQWGRKDPVRMDVTPLNGTATTMQETIQNPDIFYFASYNRTWSGTRYDNLWNTNVHRAPKDWRVNNTTGREDLPVEKTIYDPCPPGFKVPNQNAFTAFNPYGTHEKIPSRDDLGKIAQAPGTTWPNGYYDFYTDYDESKPNRRRTLSGKTIRFYATGRRNGNPGSGIVDKNAGNDLTVFYWTASPACWNNGSNFGYASCMQLTQPGDKTNLYVLYGNDTNAGFQRSHAFLIRPMQDI